MIYDKIYSLESFKKQYEAVLIISVSVTIKNLQWQESIEKLKEKIVWNNILGIASVLSYSPKSEHLDSALRIAQTCLISDTTEMQKAAASVILESLTNIPALKLAIKRKLISENYKDNLPVPFKLQNNKIRLGNSVLISDTIISLNRFQKEVYELAKSDYSLSISAPTSAGKSFILYQLLIDEIQTESRTIVYLVPTRALISQVEDDLRNVLAQNNLTNTTVTTVPIRDESNAKNKIYVFTQERLHWFLIQFNNTKIDLIIVDEAHKIDNNNRGILLQRKLEDVIESNQNVKIYFSSPFTSNPEILFSDLSLNSSKKIVNTEFVAVNQNLLYLTQAKGKSTVWNVDLITKDKTIRVGFVTLQDRPTTEAKKIALITSALADDEGGSLIYANGAADAEKYSKVLQDLFNQKSASDKVKELIKLVKNTIHKDYLLGKVLESKIAFHYGNMPLLVRQEIETLFKNNELKFLVCTSTLLEGVNLPATAIFLRKPTRGRSKPLNENDFWNLAGRAGRWGKEFSGNIVCIEPDEWVIKPSPDKRKQKIEKALEVINEKRGNELLEFIRNGSPREDAEKFQELDFAFSYYYSRYLEGKLNGNSTFYNGLINEFDNIRSKITIPNEIIFKNPGISPIAQQQLLEYFQSKENSENLESLVPVLPEDANSYQEYISLIGRIGKTLASFPPQLNAPRSLLLINWMSGKPLSYLISSSYNNYKSKGKNVAIDKVCRDVMEQVENFARFRFAKESSCYVDVLRYFLKTINRGDLEQRIPDLSLWLEFGVSQTTQLSLLSIGLSRNTVIALSEFITRTDMSKADCIDWLKKSDITKLDLSPIMIADIEKVMMGQALIKN